MGVDEESRLLVRVFLSSPKCAEGDQHFVADAIYVDDDRSLFFLRYDSAKAPDHGSTLLPNATPNEKLPIILYF